MSDSTAIARSLPDSKNHSDSSAATVTATATTTAAAAVSVTKHQQHENRDEPWAVITPLTSIYNDKNSCRNKNH